MELLKFERDTDKKIKIAAYLCMLISFGFAGWTASLVNLSVEVADIKPSALGILWSVKELPLILGFILTIILSFFSESRLLGIFVALTGFGIVMTGFANYDLFGENFYSNFAMHKFTFHMVVITFIFSIGYNYFGTSKNNLITHSVSTDKSMIVLSKLTAFSLVGTAAGYLLITILGFALDFEKDPEIKYTILYLCIGIPLIAGGILGSQQTKPTKHLKENVQIIIKSKFIRFYLLTFFESAIYYLFIIFGIFHIVSKFKVNLGFIGLAFFIQTLAVFFVKRFVTEIVNSKGIAFVMQLKFGGSLAILLAYAFVPEKFTLIILFIIFGLLQLFDNIVKTYVGGISQVNESRSNQVIYDRITTFSAIMIPVVSGFIWLQFGEKGSMVVFLLGALFAVGAVIISFILYPSSLYQDDDDDE